MPVVGSSQRLASYATGPMDTGPPHSTRGCARQGAGDAMAIHQLVPSFFPGDATGLSAVHLQWLLRRLGHTGGLFAGEVDPSLSAIASPVHALKPAPDDLALYHHGIGSPLSGR